MYDITAVFNEELNKSNSWYIICMVDKKNSIKIVDALQKKWESYGLILM